MANIKGFVLKNGKFVKKPTRKTPVQRMRERKSKKQKAVSKNHAALHSEIGHGARAKSLKGT